jgi:nitroreductase
MDFDEVVRGRRSIRRFSERRVEEELVSEILDLARCAPSSMNGQPWCFVVVRADETKRRLADAKNRFCPPGKRDYPADFLAAAPVVIAVCAERDRAHDRGRESALLASATILLAAHRFGLASVFLAAYESAGTGLREEISGILGLPDGVDPFTLLPLGHPGDVPSPKTLRPLSELVHSERYGRLPRADRPPA